MCTPIDALVAPGPRVTKHTPGRCVSLPAASAMKAAPPSWRLMTKWMLLAVLVEAVEHREVAFARHAEGVRHALRHQAFDDQVACELRVLCDMGMA